MNVLHIISSKTWRGGEQQIAYIMNGNYVGITHYLFCPENSALTKEIKQNLFTYKKRFGLDVLAAIQLKSVCKKAKINLIHLHDSHAINTYWIAQLFGLNLPAVIHRRVNFPIKNKWKYQLKGILKIIGISNEVCKSLSKVVDPDKISLIHSGIEIKKYSNPHKQVNVLKQELHISEKDKIIGTVTSLEKEKNVEEFIRIALDVVKENTTIHFVIAGNGSLQSELFITHPQIHFLGFRNNIPELLVDLDLFLFTSSSEGLGTAVLEAMAAKVPVVCRNFPAANDYIKDESTGFLYATVDDAVNKIKKLIDNTELQKQFQEKAFECVQQFDVTLMNQKIEHLYNSLPLKQY